MSNFGQLALQVELDGIRSDHPAAEGAYAELLQDLHSVRSIQAEERAVPVAGSKGVATDVIIGLGSSGAIVSLVNVFRLWLQRDRRRSLRIVRGEGANREVISIEGDNVSVDLIQKALDSTVQGDASAVD